MRQFHISRDGVTVGVFPEPNVLALCVNGTIRATDLCWTEGMTEWRPVIEIFPPPAHPLPPFMPPGPREADSAGMRLLLPVGQSGWAIVAGYLGLFSVLLIPAPFALICSFLALRDIKRSKTTASRKYVSV